MIEYLFEYRGKDATALAKDSKQLSVSTNRDRVVAITKLSQIKIKFRQFTLIYDQIRGGSFL